MEAVSIPTLIPICSDDNDSVAPSCAAQLLADTVSTTAPNN